jgi:hypothetical protein
MCQVQREIATKKVKRLARALEECAEVCQEVIRAIPLHEWGLNWAALDDRLSRVRTEAKSVDFFD